MLFVNLDRVISGYPVNETRRAVAKQKLDTELLPVLLGNDDPVRGSKSHSNVN